MAALRALAVALLLPALARADTALLEFRPPANAAEAGPITYRAYLTPEDGPEQPVELGELYPDGEGVVRASVAILSFRYAVRVSAMGPAGESEKSAELFIPARPPVPEAPDLEKVERLLEDALRELRR